MNPLSPTRPRVAERNAVTDVSLIRTVIVDDHPILRSGLRLLIEGRGGVRVVGEAGNKAEALEVVGREQPDIILLDLDLREQNAGGLDLLPQLLEATEAARVIILTGVHDSEQHHDAARLGAMGLVLKDQAGDTLIKAIQKVHGGEVWFDRRLIATIHSERSRRQGANRVDPNESNIASLTKQEREVIKLIGEGLKNQIIAQRLFISETTVRHHLTSIYSKLGVGDRLELIIFAYRHGLARLPA